MFQNVVLVFPSLNRLWNFVKEATINYSDFDSTELTLICNGKEADIEIARIKYDAHTRVAVQ